MDKHLCPPCHQKAVGGDAQPGLDLQALIKKAVDDSLREREAAQRQRPPPVPLGSPVSGPEALSTWNPGHLLRQSPPLSDDDSASDTQGEGFNYTHVPGLVKAVREALDMEDPPVSPPKQKRLFKQLNTERVSFPFLAELGEIFTDEWGKVERRGSLSSKAQRMYPFRAEDVKNLETTPVVDAAVMRLVRYVTLPLEDTATFKDPLERRMDSDLKRLYLSAGLTAKPALALATISKAMESWAESLDLTLAGVSDEAAKSSPLQEIKMASAFLGEASLDIIRLTARMMLLSVTARRALWLRPWKADAASKQAWCKIPFTGSSLFGDKLNDAIARASGGKSGLLPQDWRQQRKRAPARGQAPTRAREARAYRPGREFARSWRPRGPPAQKTSKKAAGTSAKSF